jgi:hypothetical protein
MLKELRLARIGVEILFYKPCGFNLPNLPAFKKLEGLKRRKAGTVYKKDCNA